MERIKNLSKYQKMILVLLLLLLVVFTVAYSVISARVGYAYKGAILIPQEEDGGVVYTGRVNGENLQISSTWDYPVTVQTVTFRYEQQTYGPYTLKRAPDAAPKGEDLPGVELRQGDKVLFRGGVLRTDDHQTILLNEDGSLHGTPFTYATDDGIERDENGNPVDHREPSVHTILEIAGGPSMTSKGQWILWFMGVLISGITAILVLFPDELFRWKMSFRIHNVYAAEPSDWELTVRHSSWIILLATTLIAYIVGLTI